MKGIYTKCIAGSSVVCSVKAKMTWQIQQGQINYYSSPGVGVWKAVIRTLECLTRKTKYNLAKFEQNMHSKICFAMTHWKDIDQGSWAKSDSLVQNECGLEPSLIALFVNKWPKIWGIFSYHNHVCLFLSFSGASQARVWKQAAAEKAEK